MALLEEDDQTLKSGLIARLSRRFFDKTLDINILFFNLLAITGIIAGLVVAVISAVTGRSIIVIIGDLEVAALFFLLLCIAERYKCYHLCSWIVVVAVFMLLFPMIFFYSGGYQGGMLCFFILAITFTAFLLKSPMERAVAIYFEAIIYLTCCLMAFYMPEIVLAFDEAQDYFFDSLIGFAVCSILLVIVAQTRIRMYQERQTQVLELTRELEARAKTLEHYDKMKNDFLATVAHEVNTPLAIISAYSNDTIDMLKEDPLDMDEITRNQRVIEAKVKQIDHIILDLMDYTAIENGRLPLSREPLKLSVFLRRKCNAHISQIGSNRLEYFLQPGLPKLWIDPFRIEQVMDNLISNAARYTKGGSITVELSRKDGCQFVSVADTGEGMDPEVAAVALRQYVSTKADSWRHGIGLYLCRQIVVAHGGDIWIESEKGKGTTVTFCLKEDKPNE